MRQPICFFVSDEAPNHVSDESPLPPRTASDVTVLLARASGGDAGATNELFPLVYEELRRLAAQRMAAERAGHTLQPTALVHEAYLRLVGPGEVTWQNRAHFFGAAARAIRRILTDHARGRARAKRGGAGQRGIAVEDAGLSAPARDLDLVALDEALERLAALDPQKARVVELRYYGGLTGEETAKALGISPSTVAREWQFARVWLHRELSRGEAP
jgi:RNA polymerase sigma factor (TIGR02999 family)